MVNILKLHSAERKTVEDKMRAISFGQQKSTGPVLETRQFHTIEYNAS